MAELAFAERWVEAFHDVYDTRSLSDITWFTGTAGLELIELVRSGTIRRGARVVELGSGPGVESVFLAVHSMRVIGVDLSPSALSIARRFQAISRADVQCVNGDILHVPLTAGCADVVTDSFIFHNVRPSRRDDYADEIHRLPRPGGLFVLRGYSDWMAEGSGPYRLGSADILNTFSCPASRASGSSGTGGCPPRSARSSGTGWPCSVGRTTMDGVRSPDAARRLDRPHHPERGCSDARGGRPQPSCAGMTPSQSQNPRVSSAPKLVDRGSDPRDLTAAVRRLPRGGA